jgi:predicted heme/steroid binding protein
MLNSDRLTLTAAFLAIVISLAGVFPVFATDQYAVDTGQECSVCHISASGGGALTLAGESYSSDPESWEPPVAAGKRTPLFLRLAHLLVLYAHIFFGIIWVGTILYVHLVLKPKYAMGGLPRSELRLAWISMPMLAATGAMAVFLLMFCSATFVTLYVGPRLKELAAKHSAAGNTAGKDRFEPHELEDHDGTEGRRTLIAAFGKVYDVSASPMWKGGVHAGRHRAGGDLTEYLKNAPHEADVLERYERVGELAAGVVEVPAVVRVFTVNAYLNLIGCFLIVLVLVLWRW